MKRIPVFIVFYFSVLPIWSQLPSLQKASDKAQTVFRAKEESVLYPIKYVDPFIGTGGHGHTFPGATAPFGMIQLSPDTRFDGWDGCSGYHYSDTLIYGFSHTHLSGTGVSDYGDLLILPQIGKPKKIPKYENVTSGYGERFSHKNESASPGYYSVLLEDSKIKVRLAAGKRSGIHEYTFPKTQTTKSFIIDLSHRDKVLNAYMNQKGDSILEGGRISSAWAKEQHFYFSIKLSSGIKKIKKIKNNRYIIYIDNTAEKVYLHVGVSATDVDGARKNRESEDPFDAKDFASKFTYLLGQTMLSWDAHLSKIQIKSNDKDVLTNFYSALYHSQIAPNLFSDADGRYRGMDQKIHQLNEKDQHYTVFSLWDTYRATHPLFTLIDTHRTAAFIRTFLRQFDQMNDLPVWELSANETECMIGYHSVSVIADAYLKGITSFDANKALEAMISSSIQPEFGRDLFHQNGFLSSENEPESVSKTLEYAYDDYCIAQFAKALDSLHWHEVYLKSSYNFLNIYDPQTKFMRARRGAQWYSPFVPEEVNFNYTEANAWQYSLYAPQHLEVLTNALGGKDSLESWLDRLFQSELKPNGREQADITGLIGQYAHGNEPSHHMAYLYNYTHNTHKTQKYLDEILYKLYEPKPNGLSGNEDCGQMSSWYVLSALGFYPITPGKPTYNIGRPLVDYAKIRLENGKFFEINVLNNSKENKYIKSLKLNGNSFFIPEISHMDMIEGAKLEIEMTSIPTNLRPITEGITLLDSLVFVPYITTEKRIFSDSLLIEINSVNKKGTVDYFYAQDGEPFILYENPFYIDKSTELRIKSQKKGSIPSYYSTTVSTQFILSDTNKVLELKTNYSNQYAASGVNTLIDGEYGSMDYRSGEWQGFYGTDIEALVHFSEPKLLRKIGVSCLKDHKSWIFLPRELLLYVSENNIDYRLESKIQLNVPSSVESNNELKKILFKVEEKPYRHLKFVIKNAGKCPSWHLGAGNNSWVFLDELILE